METIKYEAVFGDQSMFDRVNRTDVVIVCESKRDNRHFYDVEDAIGYLKHSREFSVEVAMRRIIKTPVWTVADQQAGRFPEVGCKALGLFDKVVSVTSVDIKNGWLTVQYENDQCVDIYRLSNLTPIETQEERAQRLEDEWVIQQLNINTLPILTEKQWRQIYRAMLSCELQSPKDSK